MTQHDSELVAFAAAREEATPMQAMQAQQPVREDDDHVTLVDSLRKMMFLAARVASNPAVVLRARRTMSTLQGVSHSVLTQRFILTPFKPFFSSCWSPAERLDRIVNHLETVTRIGGILRPRQDDVRLLTTLPMLEGDYSVKVDEPAWTNKEGLVALSLWRGIDRVFKITFMLQTIDGELVCLVGGVQGRNGPAMLDLYRDMTKQMHGLRPRDFIVELHRLFCVALDVKRVLAVSSANDHFRDRYWGWDAVEVRQINVDDVWQERGGTLGADGWYELPLTAVRKDAEQIPAKKRSLYRKRYELLDMIGPDVVNAVRRSVGLNVELAREQAPDVQIALRPKIALAS